MLKILLVAFISIILNSYSCNKEDGENNQGNEVSEDESPPGGETPADESMFKMVVLGDSLAVGVLSDTEMGGKVEFSSKNPLFKKVIESGGTKFSTAEFDDYYKLEHENIYTYGKKVERCDFSLACRLNLQLKQFVNLAASGSRVLNLKQKQLKRFSGPSELYVIQVGTNDFCRDDFAEGSFIDRLKALIDDVFKQNEKAKILVSAIPNLVRLFRDVAPPSSKALSLMVGDNEFRRYTCREVRDGGLPGSVPKCPRLSSDGTDFSVVKADIDSINSSIHSLVQEYKNKEIVFIEELASLAFVKKHISADCFHASSAGLKFASGVVFSAYKQL